MARKEGKKSTFKLVSYGIDAFLAVVIAFLVFVMISMVVSSRNSPYNVPSVFGHSFLYVMTDSMAVDKAVNEKECAAKEGAKKERCEAMIVAEDVSSFSIGHFEAGDGLIIASVNPNDIKVGDCISFFYEPLRALDTHRVKAIVPANSSIDYAPVGDESNIVHVENKTNKLKFLTRGDNLHASLSSSSDGWDISYFEEVEADKVVGKVTMASTGFGNFLSFVSPSVPGGYATVTYPLFVLVPLLIIGSLSIVDVVKEVRKEKKSRNEELAAAMAEAGIDPSDEKAVYMFTVKFDMKREMAEEREKEKERIKKKMRKQMKKEITAASSISPEEREAMKAKMKEEMLKEREKEKEASQTPELSEREKLKAELKEQMRKEREEAKRLEEQGKEEKGDD